LCFVS
jgi:hypothetical protein